MRAAVASRGEIHWVLFGEAIGSEQAGRRPALIIQNDGGNRTSPTTIVAAITSQSRSRRYPVQVPFTAEESGLRVAGLVLCEQIQTVDLRRLDGFIGSLGIERMREVDAALRWSLGLPR